MLEVDTQGRNIPVPGTRWQESGTPRRPRGQVRERNFRQLASSSGAVLWAVIGPTLGRPCCQNQIKFLKKITVASLTVLEQVGQTRT